jgi:hypothetical protein
LKLGRPRAAFDIVAKVTKLGDPEAPPIVEQKRRRIVDHPIVKKVRRPAR